MHVKDCIHDCAHDLRERADGLLVCVLCNCVHKQSTKNSTGGAAKVDAAPPRKPATRKPATRKPRTKKAPTTTDAGGKS